jgi:hypothetical protein
MRPDQGEILKAIAANLESSGSWLNNTVEDDKDGDLKVITKVVATSYRVLADMTEEVLREGETQRLDNAPTD